MRTLLGAAIVLGIVALVALVWLLFWHELQLAAPWIVAP